MQLQPAGRPDLRWAAILAAVTLALVLAVIAASASIRLSTRLDASPSVESISAARAVRQNAGGAAALGVLALAIATNTFRAARGAIGAAAGAALALTVLLSAVGFATGRDPPALAAFFNQFGGVLLAAILAWIWGRASASSDCAPRTRQLALAALAICIVQAAFGGAVATLASPPALLLLLFHAAVGLAVAACIGAVALEFGGLGVAIPVAFAVPVVGALLTTQSPSSAWQVAHALAGAALLAGAAFAHGRLGRT